MIPIFYDTETTGIRSDRDRIIEIAAFNPVHNRTFCKLVNPGQPIPKEATAVHGITDEMVMNEPSFADIADEFSAFCAGETVLIAHNNDAFDVHFLKAAYEQAGKTMPSWRFLDSLKWARRYRPDLPRHSLQHLREAYGIAANQAHRALDDVLVLHKIFVEMTDDLPLEVVVKLMEQASNTNVMPFGKHQGKPLAEVPAEYVTWLAKSGAFDKNENKSLKESFSKLGLLK